MSDQDRERCKYLEQATYTTKGSDHRGPLPTANLRPVDVERAKNAGIFEHVDQNTHGTTKRTIKVFGKIEKKIQQGLPYERVRILSWPRKQNQEIKDNGYTFADSFEDFDSLKKCITMSDYGVKRDLLGAFFQHKLPQDARRNFRFAYNGEILQQTVWLMGIITAPEYQHKKSKALVRPANTPPGTAAISTPAIVHMDDFLLGGTMDQAIQANHILLIAIVGAAHGAARD